MITFKIYVIVCSRSNKKYVGKTSQKVSQRFNAHISEALRESTNTYFHRAIRKYGPESFAFEILEELLTESEAYLKEKYWIQKLNTLAPQGYNSNSGGKGGMFNPSLEVRLKLSKAALGRIPWNKGKIFKISRHFNTEANILNEKTSLILKAKKIDKEILDWYNENKSNI